MTPPVPPMPAAAVAAAPCRTAPLQPARAGASGT